jgi:hypothetical protein
LGRLGSAWEKERGRREMGHRRRWATSNVDRTKRKRGSKGDLLLFYFLKNN